MADAITPAVEEMEKSLKNIDKVLTSSAKESFMLKKELLGINKVISTKNWEILSRFLSGTGAWRVLNKFKASILAMVQLASIQERASLAEAENMKRMADIAKDRNELLQIEKALRTAQNKEDETSLQKLRDMSDLFTGLELMHGTDAALDKLAKKTKNQIKIMSNIVGSITGAKGSSGAYNTELKTHAGILESSILQNALLASGFAVNAYNLIRLNKDNQMTNKLLAEQTDAYDKMLFEGTKLWDDATPYAPIAGGGSERLPVTGMGEFKDSETGKEEFLTKYFKENARHFEYGLKPTVESIEETYSALIEATKVWSFDIRKVVSETTGKFTGFVNESLNMNYESYMEDKKAFDAHLLNKRNAEILGRVTTLAEEQELWEARVAEGKDFLTVFEDQHNAQEAFTKQRAHLDEVIFTESTQRQLEARDALNNIWGGLGNKLVGELPEGFEEQKQEGKKDSKWKSMTKKYTDRRDKVTAAVGSRILSLRKAFFKYGSVRAMASVFFKKVSLKLLKLVSFIVGWVKKTLIFGTLILGVLFALYTAFKNSNFKERMEEAWEKTIGFFTYYVVPWLEVIGSGIGRIFEGFKEGNFFMVLEGLFMIVGGIVMAALALLTTAIKLGLELVWGSILGLWDWFTNAAVDVNKKLAYLGYIAAGFAFLIAFFTGGWVFALVGAVITGISYLIEKFTPFADGGTTTSGLSLVGEKGPELVKLPAGSTVYSNADSKKMLSAGGSNTTNITVQVQGRIGASDAEVRDMADKVAREVNLRMNRTSAAVTKFG